MKSLWYLDSHKKSVFAYVCICAHARDISHESTDFYVPGLKRLWLRNKMQSMFVLLMLFWLEEGKRKFCSISEYLE